MRIITGKARGIKLESPYGDEVRPTTEMAKEGIFSAIQFDLDSRRVLDLFAGSGQLGLEAISRGAESAVFVDESQASVEIVKRNAQKTKLFSQCRIVRMDFTDFLKKSSDTFHFIFVDPPYARKLLPEVVKKVMKYEVLADDGIIILEGEDAEIEGLDAVCEEYGVEVKKRYKYGKTYVHTVGRKK